MTTTVKDDATRDRRARPGRQGLGRVLAKNGIAIYMPYLYCLGLGIGIYTLNGNLLVGPGALDTRASAVLPLALVAFAQTLAIMTRGIDLSVGGVLSLVTAILATRGNFTGPGLVAEVALLIALGATAGALNGLVVATTRLQPFIVTLATWSIWNGLALAVLPQEGGQVPTGLASLTSTAFGIPLSVAGVVVLFAAWIWLRKTRFLLDLVAIGSDEGRARLVGVPLIRRKIQTYAFSGALAAMAGIWVAAQTQSGSPTTGDQFILSSVAAVVIGGTSIFGGRGSAASSIVASVALLMIPDLIFATNLPSFWSVFFQGLLLIVAVSISSITQQIRVRRRT